jgi:hypothetical protein
MMPRQKIAGCVEAEKEDGRDMKMTRNLFVTGVTALMVMLAGATVQAADPKRMLSEKNWEAFRVDDDKGRTCFISSLPTKSAGKYDPDNRGEARVFVSHGPGKAERNVVQFTAGYKHKKHSDVTVNIDGKKFTLFTIEGRAYAESEEDDIAMIRAMKRGSKMTVVGTSSRGTKTTDTYSLSGFTKTKNLIDKTCS